MKRIKEPVNIDIKIEIYDNDNTLLNYNLFDKYTITAYTTNIENGIVFDRTRISDYCITITSNELEQLKNGTIYLKYNILNDTDYSGTIITRYYLELPNNYENNSNSGCKCKCC